MNHGAKRIIKFGALAAFFLIIVFYAFYRSQDLIFGIKIENVNLVDGAMVSENPTLVTGNAKNAVKISLNGREISIDREGNFNEIIALLLGYNVINIKAVDKFGNEDEKNYQLIYKK